MTRRRPTTMEDIARELGVSRALVSMAFRNVPGVNGKTRQRILETADRMGYRLNGVASRLASRSTTAVGVFLLDLRQDIYADMFDGIRTVTQAAQQQLVLAVGTSDGTQDTQALDTLAQARVDLVIAAGLLLDDEAVQEAQRVTPIVSVARHIIGVDSVSSDNFFGATQATRHLVDLGHERILFLANPQTDGYRDRLRGYREVMMAQGLPSWVVQSHYSRHQAADDILPALSLDPQRRPTAVFAHNDAAAFGVLDAAQRLGLQIPNDLSVVGYDNVDASNAPGTQLTTVDIHGERLGSLAAKIAQVRLENPSSPPMQHIDVPSLIVRNTSGQAPH